MQLRSLEHLAKRGHEHLRTIEEERDQLRRENAELRTAIGWGAAAAAGPEDCSATDLAPAFPLDTDMLTPRLVTAETIPMDTCGGPVRRSVESLCFVAAPTRRDALPGYGF
ncbi:hypothetical protein WJX81_005716 [Elliptochloris bilobata]|uniref:Uncharacterized protein n=1 Tax=Elliptochloris bilobata TaxID=381761 RepID=A0AAW1RGC0_9CHLO